MLGSNFQKNPSWVEWQYSAIDVESGSMGKNGFALKLLAGLGLAMAIAQPTWAQTPSSAEVFKDPQSSDALSNLFNNRGDNATTGLFDLIQRVSQGQVDPDAFRQQQRDNINSAAADFLNRRRQLLQGQPTQPKTAPTDPIVPVTPK
jgi:hypothetical protein